PAEATDQALQSTDQAGVGRGQQRGKQAIDQRLVDDGVNIVELRAQNGDGNRDRNKKQQAIGHGGRNQGPCYHRIQQVWGEEEIPNDKEHRKAAQGHNETKYHQLALPALTKYGDAPVAIDLQSNQADVV